MKELRPVYEVEALHRQFRKVTKTKPQLPNDDALTKMLFLNFKDLSKNGPAP